MPRHRLGPASAVPEGSAKTFVVPGAVGFRAKKVIVANRREGGLVAYENYCPHMGGALYCTGRNLKCSWHGSLFDLDTGAAKTAPATDGDKLKMIEVEVVDGELWFEEEAAAKSPWADDF